MIQNFIFASVMTVFVGMLLVVCVGSYLWLKSTNPAASRTLPLPDVGGSQAGFDFLPCPSSLARVPPLTRPTPPSGHSSPDVVWAMGRGMNDFKSARSVEVTIDRDKVWLEVDGVNVFRAYNVGIVQVDDRRIVDA